MSKYRMVRDSNGEFAVQKGERRGHSQDVAYETVRTFGNIDDAYDWIDNAREDDRQRSQ